jgi:cytochrome c oxidase cbb3-type subunit III
MINKNNPMLRSSNYRKILPALLMAMPGFMWAQTAEAATVSSNWMDINTMLLIIAIILLMPIFVLGKALLVSAELFAKKQKGKGSGKAAGVLLFISLALSGDALLAQEAAAPVAVAASLSTNNWILISLILLEVLVILFLGTATLKLMKGDKPKEAPTATIKTAAKESWLVVFWNKINKFKDPGEEGDIDTGHDYDGIRELDNITPPWFTAGFILTIVFAVVYMWRYHIAKTAPLQIEEFEIEMAAAKQQQEEYLKKKGSSVDENSVVYLTAAADLSAGKVIYDEKCAVCHKQDGGGSVGPNLTDNYWIHGGSIRDIFIVVKYGVPDKGMIPWQDQLSPVQMAQVSSYIKSLVGTNPPDAKEKQGDLYVEEEAAPVEADPAPEATNI